jgi:hypothetical protein
MRNFGFGLNPSRIRSAPAAPVPFLQETESLFRELS